MDSVFQVQNAIALLLGVAVLALEVFAFVDSLRHRADAYTAAGKLNKPAWCGITGAAAAIGFITVTNPLNIFSLLAVVGASVYLADVRPAVQRMVGGGRNNGPYGPW